MPDHLVTTVGGLNLSADAKRMPAKTKTPSEGFVPRISPHGVLTSVTASG